MTKVLGIDLGTTNCCLGYYENNNFRIISLENGKRLIQACVYYDRKDGSILVGELLNKRGIQNLIFDVKRIIGKWYKDPFIQENLKFWPFVTKNPSNDFCAFEVIVNKVPKILTCEEVYSQILLHLRNTAETHLKCELKNVVITIPANFDNLQREVTLEAAQLAGLNVLKLINEPTAAALAYAHENNIQSDRLVLVYDLGGGTFDVSLVQFQLNGSSGTVVQSEGEPQLGGRDFDNALMKYILHETNIDLSMVTNKKTKHIGRRLRSLCKDIKEKLSEFESYNLDLEELFNEETSLTITRAKFEELIRSFVDKTIECMSKMLKEAKIESSEIEDVLLIGGSTRIPLVQNSVKEFFNGKELLKAINPDEAVAMGAALEAINCTSMKKEAHFINDITNVSFGIETGLKRKMSVLVKKGTKYPVDVKRTYCTVFDFQEEVRLKVYQGEEQYVKDNILLGEFSINQITPKLGGEVEILVTFGINENAVLKVTAKERSSNSVDKELLIQLQK